LKSASDFHIGKPSTDIIINGHACAPDGKQVTKIDVSAKIGHLNKTLRVFGDREWRGGIISSPKPFSTMPIIYERAYGGEHKIEEQVVSACNYNPVGTGFAGNRSADDMEGVSLPNIENPEQLISRVKDQPLPEGYAAISPSWQSRANYVGTYDEAWKTLRAPYLPLDFDKRFLNMAHPDLIYPGYLLGGEPVQINNMHPHGNLNFTLPLIKLNSVVDINKRSETIKFNMETLIIEPDRLQLGMVWKAALACDKEVLKIKNITVNMTR
jgi:hypothetical protein